MNNSSLNAKLLILTAVSLWGSAYVGIRIGLDSYGPGALALLRFAIASVGMLLLFFRLTKRQRIQRSDLIPLFLLGSLGIGVYNVALNYGEITVPSGIASFIIGTGPVITILISIVALREKISAQKWLGVFVSLIGMALIAIGEHEGVHFDYGVIYVAIASLMGALYTLILKSLLKKFHPIELASYAIWIGTLFMLIYLPELLSNLATATLKSTGAAIYLGLFPAAIAYALWSYIVSRVSAATASSYLYGMPIVATLLGFIILHEVPPLLSILGGVIALLGAIIVNMRPLQIRRATHLKT